MDYKSKLQELIIKKAAIKTTLSERKKRIDEIHSDLNVVSESQTFVQSVAQSVQSKLSSKIDGIVNLGLSTCFPNYTFKMEYVASRGKTEVVFVVKDGDSQIDPMNQCGGGLVDVLSFCLRMAVYSISNVNNVIILDEPFRFLSKSLRPKVAELLEVLCDKLNLQLIEVTHIDEFAENSDKRIFIKKIDGVSKVLE